MEYFCKILWRHLFFVGLGLYLKAITLIDADSLSEPPVLISNGERQWEVLESTLVGTQIGKFITSEKKKHVQFTIRVPKPYEDYLSVDEDTGIVYLNKSLVGLKVEDIVFYGSVKNLYQVQTEFYIKIIHTIDTGNVVDKIPKEVQETSTHSTNQFPSLVPHLNNNQTLSSIIQTTNQSPILNAHLNDNQTQNQSNLYNYTYRNIELNESIEESREAQTFPWLSVAIPLIVLAIIIPAIAILVWAVKYKFKKRKPPIKSPEFDNPVYHPTSLQTPFRRALPNRYLFNANTSAQENLAPRLDITREDNNNSKWEFPRNSLNIIGPLGEGCFGQVWQADAINLLTSGESSTVAIKTLKENATEKEKQDLLSELEVMKHLDPHPNVVTLLGCCTEADPIYVIMEHMPYGKLQTYLRDSRIGHYYGNMAANDKILSSQDLTSFAYQVAKGMQYLSSKGILHRDLAARNILVGENKLCKVSDFGLARDVIDSHIYERKSEGRLPIRWMAPESLFDNIFTTKTDIWSFGILMWEIVTLGSTPYPGMSASEVMRKVKEDYRLEKPEHCKRELYNIMYYCWDPDPELRPGFIELCDLLENILRTDTDYIDLNQFPDHSYYNVLLNSSSVDEKL